MARSSALCCVFVGLLAVLLTPAASFGVACTGTTTGLVDIYCKNLEDAERDLPCGVTGLHPEGTTCWLNEMPCDFEVGSNLAPDTATYRWHTLDTQDCFQTDGTPPSAKQCRQLVMSVDRCAPPENPDDPYCPDPTASYVCTFNCDPEFRAAAVPPVIQRWNEELKRLVGDTCHAYALISPSWRSDPEVEAEAFFTMGFRAHPRVSSWMSPDGGPYRAVDAVWEGQLFEPVLGSVGNSPLWGGPDGEIQNDRGLLREAGICVHEQGALLGSPHWKGLGFQWFPVLMRCGSPAEEKRGFKLYFSEEESIEGLSARVILQSLRRLARSNDLELLCIKDEVADQRRNTVARQLEDEPIGHNRLGMPAE